MVSDMVHEGINILHILTDVSTLIGYLFQDLVVLGSAGLRSELLRHLWCHIEG
jgi:hypothetical protein